MQDQNAPNLHFLHRTDRLAAKIGCTIKELSEPMGVSWRTIVGGRQDDANVTRKTWAALEAAEQRAGLHATENAAQPEPTDVGELLMNDPDKLEALMKRVPKGDPRVEAGRELLEQMISMQRMLQQNLELLERQQELQRKLLEDAAQAKHYLEMRAKSDEPKRRTAS